MKLMMRALRLASALLVTVTVTADTTALKEKDSDRSTPGNEKHEEGHLRYRNLSGASEVCIDFSEAGDGTTLKHGDYVQKEWLDVHGMTVTAAAATDGYTPDRMARVYDTSHAKEDPDLGSPNQKCGGPGIGSGGEPGEAGVNCSPNGEGNVLIIQESNKEEPDDNMRGGTMSFSFACPLKELKSIGLMDIDKEEKAYFEILKTGRGPGFTQMIHGLGDNSIQTETFDSVGQNVKRVDIVASNSLGVRNICFVPTDCSTGVPTLPPVEAPTTAPAGQNAPPTAPTQCNSGAAAPQSSGDCNVDFRLINASGDPIFGWGICPGRLLLDLEDFYSKDRSLDMSFEAVLRDGCEGVNSVRLTLYEKPSGASTWTIVKKQCERIPPYALFGDDKKGNFETFTPSVHPKRLEIEAFSGDSCRSGTTVGTLLHEFEVWWKSPTRFPRVQFRLVRADNGAELCELKPLSGNYLNLAKLPPQLNIRAKLLIPVDEILDPYTGIQFFINYEEQPSIQTVSPFILGAARPVPSGEVYPDISDILWDLPAWDDPKHNQINDLGIVVKETGRGTELFKTRVAFRMFNDTRLDSFPGCKSLVVDGF